MANVYRAPEVEPKKQKKKVRKAPEPHGVRETELTLEKAAANTNLRLLSGFNRIHNPRDEDNPWRQPFWFVHEWGELTGIYVQAAKVRTRGERGELKMHFNTQEARERLRRLLVNYYASGHAMGIGIIEFGGNRGFRLRTAHPQPKDPRRR